MRRVREYPFECLLAGLIDALHDARQAAAGQYRRQLQAFVHEGKRSVGPIEAGVSVASLRAFRQVRIRELAIEFDCLLQPCHKTSTVRLLLGPAPPWQRRWRTHRVRIELFEGPQPQGEVSIDGRRFKCFATDTRS